MQRHRVLVSAPPFAFLRSTGVSQYRTAAVIIQQIGS
jgi:hypothetical protein